MLRFTFLLLAAFCLMNLSAQENDLPYYQIPDYPEDYTAGGVAARIVDGLGFRFYWATEGLREEDLDFRPADQTRSTGETIDHIHGMVMLLDNVVNQSAQLVKEDQTFEEKREQTLRTLYRISQKLRNSSAEELEKYVMISRKGEEYPFWNMLNGPIADCIWHCGQIVSFRRQSGNPFNSNVSLLMGR